MGIPVGEGRNARPTTKVVRKKSVLTGNVPIPGTGVSVKPQALSSKPKVQRQIKQAVQVAKYKAAPVPQRKQILAQPNAPKVVRKVHAARQSTADRQAILSSLLGAGRAIKPGLTEVKPPRGLPGATIDLAGTAASLAGKGALALVRPPQGNSGVEKFVRKTVSNIPKDTGELAVTTPSSIAKLASTAVHHPTKVPGMLAQPYVELYHHPGKFISEHPVTATLMVIPAAKVPGRAVGRGLRLAGKQTLERPAAILPGTALKEQRVGSRDALVRAYQARKDNKRGAAQMTVQGPQVTISGKTIPVKRGEVERRVDEFHDFARKHRQRVEAAAHRQAKDLPEEQRAAHVSGAAGGAQRQVDRRFAEEFGSTWQRGENGGIVKPKNADKGALHKDRADAQAVADAIKSKGLFEPKIWEVKGATPASTRYAVVPKVAAERLDWHRRVGKSPAVGAQVLRGTRHAFTQAVLPLSPRWLVGQGVEAGFRSAIAGAGPTSLARGIRVVRAANKEKPGLGTELLMRTTGGHFGTTATARDLRTVHDFENGPDLAEHVGEAVKNPARVGLVRRGWRGYTNLVFNTVNGAIERTAQTAMLGKAVKQSHLMDKRTPFDKHFIGRVTGLSDKAIHEAVQGLHGTETQVALGRAVDRMYGQYAKFGPAKRETLLHTTPFYPWYRNVVTFLAKTLPVDHPVKTALLASYDKVTEDWRKKNKLSLRGDHRPDFLLGMYPTKGGLAPAGRYLPFAPANVVGAAGDLVAPQIMTAIKNTGGVDWKGQRLKHPGYKGKEFSQTEDAIRALTSEVEALVPGSGQALRLSGVEARYIDKKDRKAIPKFKTRLAKEVNPFHRTNPDASKSTATSRRASGTNWGGGGSGSGLVVRRKSSSGGVNW